LNWQYGENLQIKDMVTLLYQQKKDCLACCYLSSFDQHGYHSFPNSCQHHLSIETLNPPKKNYYSCRHIPSMQKNEKWFPSFQFLPCNVYKATSTLLSNLELQQFTSIQKINCQALCQMMCIPHNTWNSTLQNMAPWDMLIIGLI
jgi:hypothetical protein